MIKASQLTQQMIDFQKLTFISYFDAASAMQHQAASTMDLMLNQAGWIPHEGRQAIAAWMDACNEECDRFKTYVEQSFASLGMCFSATKAVVPAKAAKPAVAKPKKTVAAQPKKAVKRETSKTVPAEEKKVAPVKTASATPKTVKASTTERSSAAKRHRNKVLK